MKYFSLHGFSASWFSDETWIFVDFAFHFLSSKSFILCFLCNRLEIKPLWLRNGAKNAQNGHNRRKIICLQGNIGALREEARFAHASSPPARVTGHSPIGNRKSKINNVFMLFVPNRTCRFVLLFTAPSLRQLRQPYHNSGDCQTLLRKYPPVCEICAICGPILCFLRLLL